MNDADSPGEIGPRSGALIAWIDPILAARGTTLDHAQVAALERLQRLATELEAFRAARRSTLKKLFSPPDVPRGVYLWGGVGRGKSFLMDAFFATVAIRRKTRVHFHAFMREVHEELARLKDEPDPLATVAAHIARKWRLICFDEFHVADIADAMILGRLLSALFGHGVVFVMTTNYAPDGLWPDGLQRERFLPTIALLKEWLDVIEVDAGIDYRLRALEQVESYHVPDDARAEAALAAAFEAMRGGARRRPEAHDRGPHARRPASGSAASSGSISARCATGPDRSATTSSSPAASRCFSSPGIPRMSAEMGDRARRFTWLVDILYDHRVKLLASAAARPEELYPKGPNSREFARTVSRLAEMQTHDYMSEPHVAAEAPSPR